MTNGVSFYAIRIKGTEYYKGSYDQFVPFKVAIGAGVYYNRRSTAEKNVKVDIKRYYGLNNYPVTRFSILINGNTKYYSTNQEYVDYNSELYDIELMEIDLEIVELSMTVA